MRAAAATSARVGVGRPGARSRFAPIRARSDGKRASRAGHAALTTTDHRQHSEVTIGYYLSLKCASQNKTCRTKKLQKVQFHTN